MLEATSRKLQELAKKSHDESEGKIYASLLEAGLVKPGCKVVTRGREWAAVENYYIRAALPAQLKGSTGCKGGVWEVSSHAYAAETRGTPWAAREVRCRAQGRTDIILPQKAGKRLYVEIKEGEGCLTAGDTVEDSLKTLIAFGRSNRWIVWLFDPRNYQLAEGCNFRKLFLEQPAIFLPVGELLDRLDECHPKGLLTWLRCADSESHGATTNFQRVVSSNKKLDMLYSLYDEYSYDYQKFIATGELIRLCDE